MERPYHGLAYHAAKARPKDTSDAVWDEEPDAPERAYPDGSVPTECWAAARAFANEETALGGTDPWNEI